MKNSKSSIISVLMVVCIFMSGVFAKPAVSYAYQKPDISADAAILMDLKSGQVLYSKNPFKRRPPASTTKVITALLAIENGRLSDQVKVSKKAAYTEGSSMYLRVGEVVRMSDLLYGALMHSGNDACEAIAEHVGGNVKDFARLMNLKALSLGAVNTHFTNPHGLPDEDHYTCAYDLALITRYALKNPVFAQVVSTRNKLLKDLDGEAGRALSNTNQLLWKYFWADGVKTGTTSAAGQCLVSSATKGNRQLVAVVLKSGSRWNDSIKLLEYGFNQFEYSQVAVAGAEYGRYSVQNGKQKEISVVYESDHGVLVPVENPQSLEKRVTIDSYPVAPIKKGAVIGSVSYFINDSFAGRVNLITAADVDEQGIWGRMIEWINLKIRSIWGMFLTNNEV